MISRCFQSSFFRSKCVSSNSLSWIPKRFNGTLVLGDFVELRQQRGQRANRIQGILTRRDGMRLTLNQPNGQQFWSMPQDVVFRHGTPISFNRPVGSLVTETAEIEYFVQDFVNREISKLNRQITNQLSGKMFKSQSIGSLSKLYSDLKQSQVSVFKLDRLLVDRIFPPSEKVGDMNIEWLNDLSKRHIVYSSIAENPIHFFGSQVAFNQPASTNSKNEDLLEFGLRNEQEIELLLKMIRWCRTQSPEFTGFMTNLKRALAQGSQSASIKKPPSEVDQNPFNQDSDRLFLQTIVAHAFVKDPICRSPYEFIVQSILRPLYYYTDSSGAARLLNDIKIVVPWDFRDFVVEKALQASSNLKDGSILAQRQQERILMQKVSENLDSIGLCAVKAESNLKFEKDDIVHSKRIDFGQMECFTIDSADTVDVDDAISIEPCSNDSDAVWIHVHIADPTVLVKPGTSFWNHALDKSSSCYLAEETIHMMHPTLTRTFSLEPNRSNYTITVSAKLSKDTGNVLDYKIQPGIIRNVIKWNYSNLDQMVNERWSIQTPFKLDFSKTEWHTEYPQFEHDLGMMNEIDQRKQQVLSLLSISEKLRMNRLQSAEDAVISMLTKAEPKLKSKQSLAEDGYFQLKPRASRAIPEIKFEMDLQHLSPSRQFISEFMILAGQLMAQYSSERQIPVVFRNQESLLRAHKNDETKLKFIEDTLQKYPERIIPPSHSLLLLNFFSASSLSTTSGEHGMLGVKNYCQATSPIRRASDLITHWQVKQSFLEDSNMSISSQQVDDMLPRLLLRERQTKKMQRANAMHWSKIYLMSRSNEGDLFDGYLYENSKSSPFVSVFVKQVGQKLLLKKDALKPGFENQIGCWIRVRAETDTDKARIAGFAASTRLQQV